MTAAGWVVMAVLAAAVVWVGLALTGLVREVARLREQVEAMSGGSIHLDGGVPVGTRAPAWSLETADGPVASDGFVGRRHLLVFADADCRTCDELMPAAVQAAGAGTVPPMVIVGRDGSAIPSSWRGPHVVAGAERDRAVSDAFRVDVSPHVFVLDEQGSVVAQGGVVTLRDVEALVRDAQGIRIVPGSGDG